MIRRPPRSTQSRSSAASDVYKRQPGGQRITHPAVMLLLFLPRSILNILMHSCRYSAAITSLMCRVASVRPCRIRITPKSWNRKWPQVKLRRELTISEQCSENISHKHALSYKKQRPALRVGIRPRRHTFCSVSATHLCCRMLPSSAAANAEWGTTGATSCY